MWRMDETAWEVRRPDLLLEHIAELHPFDRPRTYLARVDGPYEAQRLGGVTVLWDEPAPDETKRTRLTERALERLDFCWMPSRDYRSRPLAVPVVVRPGSAWPGWDEEEALLGLRYGSNSADVRQGDVLTVTARGWFSFLDELWGTTPCAQWVSPGAGGALLDSAAPAGPQGGECLPCFLRRVIDDRGCEGLCLTHEWQRFQRRRGVRTSGLTAYLKRNGGFCDCEVLMNVYPQDGPAGEGCTHVGRLW